MIRIFRVTGVIVTLILFCMLNPFSSRVYSAIDYAEITFYIGNPEIKCDGEKISPEVGKRVPISSEVKTGKDGQIVFSYKGLQFSIKPNRDARLEEIIRSNYENKNRIKSVLDKIVKDPDGKRLSETTAAGVRGADYDEENPTWDDGSDSAKDSGASNRLQNCLKLIENKQYDKVIDTLKNPQTGEDWYLLGLAYLKTNNEDKAINALEKASSKSSSVNILIQSNVSLSYIYMNKGSYKLSISKLGEIVGKLPEKSVPPEVWYMLMINNEFIANTRDAEKYRGMLLKYHPNSQYSKMSDN
jgi:tetratricopeptide (TPR) repeat protein